MVGESIRERAANFVEALINNGRPPRLQDCPGGMLGSWTQTNPENPTVFFMLFRSRTEHRHSSAFTNRFRRVRSISISATLRKIREDRFLSQRQLAQGIGIETAQISRYERGIALPNADTLLELSQFRRVGVGALLGEEEQTFTAQPIQDI